MNITLPDNLRELLEEWTRKAGLASVDEYVLRAVMLSDPEQVKPKDFDTMLREAIAADRDVDPEEIPQEDIERRKQEILAEVRKGLESGPATPMTKEDWATVRQRVADRLAQQRGDGK
jgi:Arc/MetJ-type ribon-helix-helix transcriptional regulator